MTKIKSEIAVALSDDTDMDSLTDNEKIAEIKNIFTGSIKESVDYVKGFKMAKTLQFEKSKKSLINWARKSVGWGLDDLIFETASTLTEESSIVSVLKKYLEDFSFVKPTNYVVTSSLLKSDTARMRVIPWLDESFLRVGLSLESDIAIVATLKKHFSLDGPDSYLRLVNSLKLDKAVLNIVKDLSIYDEDSPVFEFYTYCVAIKLKEDESKLKAISLMHRDYFKFQLARTIQGLETRLEACKLIEDVDLKKQLLVGDNIQYIDQIESPSSRLRH